MDEKINICIRMFSFAWSSNLLREFLNLLVDYEDFGGSDIWNHLNDIENKI